MSDHFTDHFLIAMPALADPNFSQTVTYICEHNNDGALGLVVNRPADLTLGELLQHLGFHPIRKEIGEKAVYVGGPVQRERGFVLHEPGGTWESSLSVSPQLAVTTSKDVLEAIAEDRGPERYLVALGYAGWGPGQLDREMAENAWLSGPADATILFDQENHEKWRAAARLLGVDLSLLSSDTGHG